MQVLLLLIYFILVFLPYWSGRNGTDHARHRFNWI